MPIYGRLKQWANRIKADVAVLAVAARDPRTPWIVKVLALAIVAYALSPIDLIPDFIPVLGLLDELILLPAAIALVLRLIPAPLMIQYREEAARRGTLPKSRVGAAIVVWLWCLAVGALLWWFMTSS